MVRRFVYDAEADAVVELGEVRPAADPAARYADARGEYNDRSGREASQRLGEQYRAATLERADRREWAYRARGDERRWRE
jgi:hypothetical protein